MTDRYARLRPWAPYLAAAVLIVCFVQQCLTGMVRRSATFDEPAYITSGYAQWRIGGYPLKRDAPPLVGLLAGGTLRALESLGTPLVWQEDFADRSKSDYKAADRFFEANEQRSFFLLQAARLPIVFLGALLGVVLFRFGRLLFGTAAGLLALFLFALDPNMIAHATIVSADLPLACFFLAAHASWYRLLSAPGMRPLAPLACWVALTLCVKFTGLLVLPSLALVGLVCYFFPPESFLQAHSATASQYRAALLRKAALAAPACAAAAMALMTVLYQRWDAPVAYYNGLSTVYANVIHGYYYYLLGEFRTTSWPHYYLVAMLLKTPEPALILFVLGLLPWKSAGRAYPWRKLLVVLVPLLLVHLVCSLDRANLGLRRVLLVYPFLLLIAGRVAEAWRSDVPVWRHWHYRPWQTAALGLLMAAQAATAWWIHPYQLAYFATWCGGPGQGHRYLDDSNIDWGQDLPSLADYLAEQQIESVRYLIAAVEPPQRYGIAARPLSRKELPEPTPDVYAIGVHLLIRFKHDAQQAGDPRLDWLSRFTPTKKIGYSIYVYDLRQGLNPLHAE